MSFLQHFLQARAGGLFVLVKGVGVDIQRGGGMTVAEDARYRCYIRTACDHEAGGGVPERMDVQLLRQAVLLEDQLEAPGEGGGRHGELRSLTAEQEVISGQLPLVIGFGDIPAFFLVLPQEVFHLGGEVDIAVPGAGLGFFIDCQQSNNILGKHAEILRNYLKQKNLAYQNGYDRLMNEVHHDGNIKENRIAEEDRSAVERGPCAAGLGYVDAAVFQGHHLCVPRY